MSDGCPGYARRTKRGTPDQDRWDRSDWWASSSRAQRPEGAGAVSTPAARLAALEVRRDGLLRGRDRLGRGGRRHHLPPQGGLRPPGLAEHAGGAADDDAPRLRGLRTWPRPRRTRWRTARCWPSSSRRTTCGCSIRPGRRTRSPRRRTGPRSTGFSEPTTHIAKNCEPPPYACPSALRAPSTWCSPAAPRTWRAASPKRSMPEAPIGFDESTPPEQLTGSLPSIAVSPDSVELPAARRWLGEAERLQPHRLEPRERHVDLGHVDLVDRVGDAGLLPERGGGVTRGLRVDLVALGGRGRLGTHHRAVDPGRVATSARPRPRRR